MEGCSLNPVFEVEVWNMQCSDAPYATLWLPATSYELLNALERIGVSNIDDATVTISESMEFEQELAGMKQPLHLGQLNALAERLSQLSQHESVIFEGLCQMEAAKGQDSLDICRAIDLAYSTACCHVVPSALNDSQLGRFYAENGFFSELDKLSDEMFELLDFESIGTKMRKGEGGVFTTHGYVVQHTELKQVADSMDFKVQPPSYIFRVGVENCTQDDSGPRKVEYLELPATEAQLNELPEKLGLEDWLGTAMVSLDGPLPDFNQLIISTDELPELNDLAKRIQTIAARRELPKYKAILSAERCQDIDKALSLADALDAYYYTPSLRTVEEAGREELRLLMDHNAAELAMQHMNLTTYGKAVMERHHSVLTDYGTVERMDGQPIHRQEPKPPIFQMSM